MGQWSRLTVRRREGSGTLGGLSFFVEGTRVSQIRTEEGGASSVAVDGAFDRLFERYRVELTHVLITCTSLELMAFLRVYCDKVGHRELEFHFSKPPLLEEMQLVARFPCFGLVLAQSSMVGGEVPVQCLLLVLFAGWRYMGVEVERSDRGMPLYQMLADRARQMGSQVSLCFSNRNSAVSVCEQLHGLGIYHLDIRYTSKVGSSSPAATPRRTEWVAIHSNETHRKRATSQ